MALLAVAYPHLTASDHAWIQAIRQQHDSNYRLIGPHFTLVFPERTLSQTAFVDHIRAQSTHIRTIPFTLRCAIVVKDSFSPATHLFLVPDQGFSALVKLHDALYDKALAPSQRLDVPFIPHITIGDSPNPYHIKELADDINHQDRSLEGHIDAIDIISYDDATVVPITRIALT